MKRAGLYIFRQLFWWVVFVSVCLTGVIWLTQSLRYVELIVDRGLSAPLFIYFTMLLLPTFFAMILPIALFMGVIFTYNKLIMDNELVVMRSAGLSQNELARPALVLAGYMTLIGYALSLYFIPASFRAFKDLETTIRNTYSGIILQEGVFNAIMAGITVYVRTRSSEGELLGIIVHDNRIREKPVTMMSERGAIVPGENGPRVVMVNGNRQEINEKDGTLSLLYFDRYNFEIEGYREAPALRWRKPRERFLHELFFPPEQKEKVWSYNQLRMEGHDRLASPLMNLALALIGIVALLTGDYNRRGQRKRIVSAVAVVIAVEAAMLGAKSYGRVAPEAAFLLYISVLAPIAGGFYLLYGRRRRLRRIPHAAPAE